MNRLILLLLLFFYGLALPSLSEGIVQDEFIDEWFKDKTINKVEPFSHYNYANTERVKILITPTEKVSTPKKVYEGQVVNFVTKRNVRLDDNTLLKKGTPLTGVVELYTTNGMTGVHKYQFLI